MLALESLAYRNDKRTLNSNLDSYKNVLEKIR